jgi:hypothetical protein
MFRTREFIFGKTVVYADMVKCVVCFLLGNSPASEIYMPTFRNTLFHLYPLMKMEQCSETSAYKIQTRGNYPEESIKHLEQGESLKSC